MKFVKNGRGFALVDIEINHQSYSAWYDNDGRLQDCQLNVRGKHYAVPHRNKFVRAKLEDFGRHFTGTHAQEVVINDKNLLLTMSMLATQQAFLKLNKATTNNVEQ